MARPMPEPPPVTTRNPLLAHGTTPLDVSEATTVSPRAGPLGNAWVPVGYHVPTRPVPGATAVRRTVRVPESVFRTPCSGHNLPSDNARDGRASLNDDDRCGQRVRLGTVADRGPSERGPRRVQMAADRAPRSAS